MNNKLIPVCDSFAKESFGDPMVDIVDEDLKYIFALDEDGANFIWNEYCIDLENNNFNFIIDWIEDYNDLKIDRVRDFLLKSVNWNTDKKIYYCSSKYFVLTTSWGIFLKNWINFFEYDDDGAYVICEGELQNLLVAPLGNILINDE